MGLHWEQVQALLSTRQNSAPALQPEKNLQDLKKQDGLFSYCTEDDNRALSEYERAMKSYDKMEKERMEPQIEYEEVKTARKKAEARILSQAQKRAELNRTKEAAIHAEMDAIKDEIQRQIGAPANKIDIKFT